MKYKVNLVLFIKFWGDICMIYVVFVVDCEFFICVSYKKGFICGIWYDNFILYSFEYDFYSYVCERECFVDYFWYYCSVVKIKCVFGICIVIFYNVFVFVLE